MVAGEGAQATGSSCLAPKKSSKKLSPLPRIAPLNTMQISDLEFIRLYLLDRLAVCQAQFAPDQLFWPVVFLLFVFLADSFPSSPGAPCVWSSELWRQ